MPANILLLNVHSYCNAGDAALTEVALQELRRNFPGCKHHHHDQRPAQLPWRRAGGHLLDPLGEDEPPLAHSPPGKGGLHHPGLRAQLPALRQAAGYASALPS